MDKSKSTSFGRYLKTVRLEKGIRLSAISSRTRISKVTLEALEDEDHGRLPAEVFVIGFIRAHARVVGADGDVAVRGYAESRRLLDENRRQTADVDVARANTGVRLLIFLGILVLLAAVAIFVMRGTAPVKTGEQDVAPAPAAKKAVEAALPTLDKTAPAPAVTSETPEPAEPAAAGPPPETGSAAAPTPKPSAAPETRTGAISPKETDPVTTQRVHIQVVEDTWLKVIIDSLSTQEYSLAPGDRLELEAAREFNLLIGNATGIRLTFNDNPITIPGKTGQVVTIQLP